MRERTEAGKLLIGTGKTSLIWKPAKEEAVRNWPIDRGFRPAISAEERTNRIKGWNQALQCACGWAGTRQKNRRISRFG